MKLIVRVKGGLGNQLYCYAAARSIAIKNNAELVIDSVSGFVRDKLYKRTYQLDNFCITSRIASPSERLEPFERLRRGIKIYSNRYLEISERSYIQETDQNYKSSISDLKLKHEITILDGLWQSENYFKNIETIIRNDLKPKTPLDLRNKQFLSEVYEKNTVCIHLRWFDESSEFPSLGPSFYINAIKEIKASVANPVFIIFSEKPNLARKFLNFLDDKAMFVDWNYGVEGAIQDFILMINCRHFIIPNSTFSWWAAWLGKQHKDQLVFYPRFKSDSVDKPTSWDLDGQIPNSWNPILIK